MVRVDYALQLMIRQHMNQDVDTPDFWVLNEAIKELKRLYRLEIVVADLVEDPPEAVTRLLRVEEEE